MRFLSSQDLRKRITSTTNKAESYNNFSKWLFFGGEVVTPDEDPEEQTKKLKCNHLLAASVVLQNAVDITAVLRSLAVEGYAVRQEDLAQLSPYLAGHVKRFGDYVVDVEATPDPLDGEMLELAD